MPGIINLRVNSLYLAEYMEGMTQAPKLGLDEIGHGETIIVDYGGANVAKPLHVGHLLVLQLLEKAFVGWEISWGYHMVGMFIWETGDCRWD